MTAGFRSINEECDAPDATIPARSGSFASGIVFWTGVCLQGADVSGRRFDLDRVRRGGSTDAQWRRLEPHLPPEKPWTGHPNAPYRRIINGIL